MSENHFYVYLLFRWNGIPLFVGKGHDSRWLDHELPRNWPRDPNKHKVNAVKKTLLILGEVPKIKLADNLTEDEAFGLEVFFISTIGRKAKGGPLVNMTDGGEGFTGGRHSERSKLLISEGGLGREVSEETRAKISAYAKQRGMPLAGWNKGKTGIYSPESLELMRQAGIKRGMPCAGWTKGTNLSAEHRASIGAGVKRHLEQPGALDSLRSRAAKAVPANSAAQKEVWEKLPRFRITNGITETLHPKNAPIPEGWRRGRKSGWNSPTKRKELRNSRPSET